MFFKKKNTNHNGQNNSAATVTKHGTENNYKSHELTTIECSLEEISANDIEC